MAKSPTVLVTGFEPFGGDLINPSWEIARALDGWDVPDCRDAIVATVRAARLPCVFGAALDVLHQALARHRPVAVIALGLAASRADISVERVAINVDDARIPDNRGQQPIDRPVCPGAPAAYWSTLPIKAIVAAWHEAGIPASVSQSAGTFVCNHVFYGLAHRLATRRRRGGRAQAARRETRAGFIHVPWLAGHAGAAAASAMDSGTAVDAVRIAIRVTLTRGEGDLELAAGALD